MKDAPFMRIQSPILVIDGRLSILIRKVVNEVTNLHNAFTKINSLKSEMNDIFKMVGVDAEDVVIDRNNLDEKFMLGQLQDIVGLLDDLNFKIEYLSKEVSD